jgi:biopolymer transport protein ExbD
MGIRIPQFHLRAKWDLPSLRKRLHGGGRKSIEAELNLVAMIDLFSTLILFLLASFSATGEVIVASKDIMLPTANNSYFINRAPIVTVTAEGVTLEGMGVGDNANIEDKLTEADWELPAMKQQLRSYKEFFEAADPGVPFPAEVILQADRKLNFLYIKRVMYTLVDEGYPNISLVVRGEASLDRAKEALEDAGLAE